MTFPIYIPSRGRAEVCTTPKLLTKASCAFKLVVEPHEVEAYAKQWGQDNVLTLPESNRGLVYSRNWIKAHAEREGSEYHWQMDDDILSFSVKDAGKVKRCDPAKAISALEECVAKWSNVSIAGLAAQMNGHSKMCEYEVNRVPFTCVLVKTNVLIKWRPGTQEDMDFALQILAGGQCTIRYYHYMMICAPTETMSGGCSTEYASDGRLARLRRTQSLWPNILRGIKRQHGVPKLIMNGVWSRFTTPLKAKV